MYFTFIFAQCPLIFNSKLSAKFSFDDDVDADSDDSDSDDGVDLGDGVDIS